MKQLLLLVPGLATAAEVHLSVEIPRLQVAEYHRPYVAAWIEAPDRSVAANLAVWYDVKMADEEGEKWLKDLRQWWRKAGRSLEMPVDGVSSPTRPPGKHDFHATAAGLPPLEQGEYHLVVEASREVGGRELVRIPFSWDGKTAVNAAASGKSELAQVTLSLKPATTPKS